MLSLDGQPLNGNDAQLQAFTRSTGAVATVFAAQGQGDFVRIATTLKNEKGDQSAAVLGSRLTAPTPPTPPSRPAKATWAWPTCSAAST